MIYHILPEYELFSAYWGGAIACNVANMMRFDASKVVVCQASDDSWGYRPDRILIIPGFHRYRRIPGRKFLPLWIHRMPLRFAFSSFTSQLKVGDVVWCHNQTFVAAALERVIHEKGAKLIYHGHDPYTYYSICTCFRCFTADAYVFVSHFLRQHWLKSAPNLRNTYAVHNGVDETLFYPQTQNVDREIPVILYVGRLARAKGIDVLMEAMRILEQRGVKAICRVVGASSYGGGKVSRYTEKLLKTKPSNVQFSGYCSHAEIADEYRAADIFCCPSIWPEPFGNVNIEAMACGIPVVATRVGGIPEIAAEGGVVLVEPNLVVELANALQKLVEDKGLRATIAGAGLVSARKRFTWHLVCQQYRSVVDCLM